ncbi:Uma2 family endonuclease [Aquisphaera insulae]|uniref:Uma2 family endonuclease n=1 Tax=Aquisphaera insulae TaxID=2712864 RepID=UPI0013EBC5FF|nr:Uma2 family endonuclease [Aquisphaera insulae]
MSTAVAIAARRLTPEDLLALPDGKDYELVDGRLLERPMGAESSRVGTRLCSRLDRFSEDNGLGIVWGADNGYQCFPHAPGMVRKPDISFVKAGRLSGDIAPRGWVRIVPDLVVEVVSPNDSAEELEGKLEDYAKAGVPLVWVIYPERRRARVFGGDGSTVVVDEDDDLTGDVVLPGFRCPLREILPARIGIEPPADPGPA